MAKRRIVWEADDGFDYDSEEKAKLADLRHAARCCLGGDVDFDILESLNESSLEPILNYFTELMKKSRERTNKHG